MVQSVPRRKKMDVLPHQSVSSWSYGRCRHGMERNILYLVSFFWMLIKKETNAVLFISFFVNCSMLIRFIRDSRHMTTTSTVGQQQYFNDATSCGRQEWPFFAQYCQRLIFEYGVCGIDSSTHRTHHRMHTVHQSWI